MVFLVQIREKIDGTYEKGTSEYPSGKAARIQFHTAMSAAMSKADTKKICCILMNDSGTQIKHDIYEVNPSEDAASV